MAGNAKLCRHTMYEEIMDYFDEEQVLEIRVSVPTEAEPGIEEVYNLLQSSDYIVEYEGDTILIARS